MQNCNGITMHQKPYIDNVELLHILVTVTRLLTGKNHVWSAELDIAFDILIFVTSVVG